MIKIIIWGACGRMGQWVSDLAAKSGEFEIFGGVDAIADVSDSIVSDWRNAPKGADVVIDFSRPDSVDDILSYCLENNCGAVLATTGYTDIQRAKIDAAAKKIPVFQSGNMSIGVNTVTTIVEAVAKSLGASFDIEIIEAHHHNKIDSPSGTSLMLLDAAKRGRSDLKSVEFGRHNANHPRKPEEIGVHSVRGGTIVGEHSVLFCGNDEIIEIKHTALSRAIFGEGALRAAKRIVGAPPRLYSMKDVL